MNTLVITIAFVAKGIGMTLELLFGGLLIGLCLGTAFAILRHQKMVMGLINRVISLLRGTPMILQLSFVYFAIPNIIGCKLDVLIAGIITFGLNSSAYIAEIFRSGIENLPVGQFEAAKSLQIPNFYLWKDIVFPQVIRNILPALINEVIALLKETALIATIGGMDLMRHSELIAAEQFTYFIPLCVAGAYYYGLVSIVTLSGKILERRISLC